MKGKLDELTAEELKKSLDDSKADLRKERFKAVTSKLDNTKKISQLKKHIARIHTLNREYELGKRQRKK